MFVPLSFWHCLHGDQCLLLAMPTRPGHPRTHIDYTLHNRAFDAHGQRTPRAELHPCVNAPPDHGFRLEPEQHRHVRVQAKERCGQAGANRG